MRAPTWALPLASVVVMGTGACADASDPDFAHAQIGPAGGLITSVDSILTIAIQPGALEETLDVTIERNDDPPDVFGPAFRVRPNVELAIPATVTYRHPLPDDTSAVAVGYIGLAEFEAGEGRWRPLPLLRLDPAQKLVTASDDRLDLYYGLLDDAGSGSGPSPTTMGTTGPVPTGSGDATTGEPSGSDSGTTTGTPDPTTDSGPGDTSTETTDTTDTTGSVIDCGAIPPGPLMVDEFSFDGAPLDGNAEDLTFSTVGSIIVRNGIDLVEIDPAGTVTPIVTSQPLPDTLGLRWTISGNIVTASLGTGELLQIAPDGTVTTLWSGLGIPNAVYPAIDGNIFFSDFTGTLAAYIDEAGTMLTVLGQGGNDAPETNGIIYDPDRNYVYYVSYGPGILWRVDVTDLANPGLPENLLTIGPTGPGDMVGLDGITFDACGNLYIVDQNLGAPGSLFRVFLDAAGDVVGAPELLVEAFPDGVANAVFAQGPGWEAYETTMFVVGLPGRIFMVDVGVPGAPTAVTG